MLSISRNNSKVGLGFYLAPRTRKIMCLMFADDSLLFCKGTTSACNNLRIVIDKLCALSGQLVNFHESPIVFSKMINNTRRDNLVGIFNMTTSMSLGRYLGA